MQRIVARPDEMRSLGASLRQTAMRIRAEASRLNGALSALDWEVREQVTVDEEFRHARAAAAYMAGQAEQMADLLLERADALEQADQEGMREIGRALEVLLQQLEEFLAWAGARGLDAAGIAALVSLTGAAATPVLAGTEWMRRSFPEVFGPAPAPPQEAPASPVMLGKVDLSQYFSPAQATALRYTLHREGEGFTTAHGSVYYEKAPGVWGWDATILNYGVISFAFPAGRGYGLINRLVNDEGARAELERLMPAHISDPALREGFIQAFNSGNEGAAAWWREHAMADEHRVKPEWIGLLKAWAGTEPNQRVQLEQVSSWFMATATTWADKYGIESERGLSFLFDVSVQQGRAFEAQWNTMAESSGWSELGEQEKLQRMLSVIDQPVSSERKKPIVNGGAEFEAKWGLSYDRKWKQ